MLPDGLTIAATLPREDPRDAFVLPPAARGDVAAALAVPGPPGRASARAASGASRSCRGLRRRRASRRSAATSTRACASSMRANTTRWCSPPPACAGSASATASRRRFRRRQCVPAPGQGIIAIEVASRRRTVPARAAARCTTLAASAALEAERRVVSALGGGCQLPLGALATINDAELELQAIVCSPDGAANRPRPGQWARRRPAGARRSRRRRSSRRDGAVEILDEVTSDRTRCTDRPFVYIVGAGPGDPSLMTVRGRDCVAACRCRPPRSPRARRGCCAPPRPDAERIDVGAAAPKPLDQDAISYLLADKAREGKVVVRLKWGDPFVFDSGGKEALFLHEQRIPFEVVSGSARDDRRTRATRACR